MKVFIRALTVMMITGVFGYVSDSFAEDTPLHGGVRGKIAPMKMEAGKHAGASSAGVHKDHSAKGQKQRLTGRLIGLTCFMKHDAIGENHKGCFKQCAEKGLPVGVLTDDGKIYQIAGKGHDDLQKTNRRLLKYAEERVTIIGEVFSKNGTHMIVIQKIKKS